MTAPDYGTTPNQISCYTTSPGLNCDQWSRVLNRSAIAPNDPCVRGTMV